MEILTIEQGLTLKICLLPISSTDVALNSNFTVKLLLSYRMLPIHLLKGLLFLKFNAAKLKLAATFFAS